MSGVTASVGLTSSEVTAVTSSGSLHDYTPSDDEVFRWFSLVKPMPASLQAFENWLAARDAEVYQRGRRDERDHSREVCCCSWVDAPACRSCACCNWDGGE